MNLPNLYNVAFSLAEQALDKDSQNELELASVLYNKAIKIFSKLSQNETKSKKQLIDDKINEFSERVNQIHVLRQQQQQQQPNNSTLLSTPIPSSSHTASSSHTSSSYRTPLSTQNSSSTQYVSSTQVSTLLNTDLKIAQILLEKALQFDEQGSKKLALPQYVKAAEKYLKSMKVYPQANQLWIEQRVENILDRIEELKLEGSQQQNCESTNESSESNYKTKENEIATTPMPTNTPHNAYTAAELDVLRRSSTINNCLFQPWMETDVNDSFSSDNLFIDTDGLLALSSKQRLHFDKWQRASEFMKGGERPLMIQLVSPYVITQDVITDCSFVASLCITAAYEQRFKKKLITRIIYPQDHTGTPIFNPSGKYVVKLWFNGVPRKVVIDDYFPIRSNNKLLTSYTTNPRELWVSIVEKAYMKVNGGYDFPGSNSGIDLFALTGWIPESLNFEPENGQNAESERIWQRFVSAHKYGDCLITIATGEMSEEEGKRLGLVPTHAYAVLDVREIHGLRLLQVKNPWSRKRWMGPCSVNDTRMWSSELQQELQYDLNTARNSDNGIFWIDYQSVQRHFHSLFLNWNPELFSFRTTLHKHWSLDCGPKNDLYNMGYNPQYSLLVVGRSLDNGAFKTGKSIVATIWILLSQHTTMKRSATTESKDQVFLTLHVGNRRKGRRIYYSNDAHIRGVYSNNPHTLVSLEVTDSDIPYTLVVSQYEKLRGIDYTLSVYSTAPFSLSEAPFGPLIKTTINGEWNESTAGGSPKYHTFMMNPQWKLTCHKLGSVGIYLEAPVSFAVNIQMLRGKDIWDAASHREEVASTGDYRPGFCYFEIDDVPPGEYTIVPSTFHQGVLGSFRLTVATDYQHTLVPLSHEGEGMILQSIHSLWSTAAGTAAGCTNFNRYTDNPRYLLEIKKSTEILVRLQTPKIKKTPATNVSIYPSNEVGEIGTFVNPSEAAFHATSNKGIYENSVVGVATTLTCFPSGYYAIVPSTFQRISGEFKLLVYSSSPVIIKKVR